MRLIQRLADRNIHLWQSDGMIRYAAPPGVLSEDDRNQIRGCREWLLSVLPSAPTDDELQRLGEEADAEIEAHQVNRFNLTIQQAYKAACAGLLPDSGEFLRLYTVCRGEREKHGSNWFRFGNGAKLAYELIERAEERAARSI